MRIYDWITNHPDDHVRIISYEPAPDIQDEHGDFVCGGEGTSTIVFDSTTGDGDLSPDLLLKEVTAANEGDDGTMELEYIPDAYYILW